jgi:hypothetical protein
MDDPFDRNPFQNKQKKKKKGKQPPTNFIEALKEIGSSVKKQSKDAAAGTIRGSIDQISGQNSQEEDRAKGDSSFNFEEYLKSREEQVKYRERKRYERKKQMEKSKNTEREKRIQQQIKALQQELKKLTSQTDELNKDLEKAAKEKITDPGIYHVGFLERIKKLIELANKQVAESRTWLQEWKNRSKKKSHYWKNVKKSGTKFMLSHERYMVTQKG